MISVSLAFVFPPSLPLCLCISFLIPSPQLQLSPFVLLYTDLVSTWLPNPHGLLTQVPIANYSLAVVSQRTTPKSSDSLHWTWSRQTPSTLVSIHSILFSQWMDSDLVTHFLLHHMNLFVDSWRISI